MNTQIKITGGKKSFSVVINEAYYGRGSQMHSPCIRYSHDRGFHCEPLVAHPDSDVIWQAQAFYHPDGSKAIFLNDYNTVMRAILND